MSALAPRPPAGPQPPRPWPLSCSLWAERCPGGSRAPGLPSGQERSDPVLRRTGQRLRVRGALGAGKPEFESQLGFLKLCLHGQGMGLSSLGKVWGEAGGTCQPRRASDQTASQAHRASWQDGEGCGGEWGALDTLSRPLESRWPLKRGSLCPMSKSLSGAGLLSPRVPAPPWGTEQGPQITWL